MRIFVPAELLQLLVSSFEQVKGQIGLALEVQKPVEELCLNDLNCIAIEDHRAARAIRSPFVFPFMLSFQYYSQPSANPATSVDWIYLSGDMHSFLVMTSQCLSVSGSSKVSLCPFNRMSGTVAQSPAATDYPFKVIRHHNVKNENTVASIEDKLTSTNFNEWGQFRDTVHLVNQWERFETILRRSDFAPKSLVDLGCGLGVAAHAASQSFPESKVLGVDFSPATIRANREAIKAQNLSFELGSMECLDMLVTGSTDLIFSTYALNQSINQTKAAMEAFRVLSEKGRLMALVVSESYFQFWKFPGTVLNFPDTGFVDSEWSRIASLSGYSLSSAHVAFSSAYLDKDLLQSNDALIRSIEQRYTHSYSLSQPWGHNFLIRAEKGENWNSGFSTYFDQLEQTISSYLVAPPEVQEFARIVWAHNVAPLQLNSYALEFLKLIVPTAGRVLEQSLSRVIS